MRTAQTLKFLLTACGGCAILAAQTPVSAVPAQASVPAVSQVANLNLAYEPVGPGDLLYISVTGSPELSNSYRIAQDGRISLPLLRARISVSGLLSPGIADEVSRELVSERILVAPIVSVSVLDYRSRTVSIVGAVRFPKTIQALGNMTLLDALARAQGVLPEAGPEVIVSSDSVKRISLKALLSGSDPSLNLLLKGGEEIRVPEAPKLYVVGNVKAPGTYPLMDLEGSSVLKVLAQSQGVLPFTAKEAYVYRSMPGSAKREEIEIELNKILRRKTSDFPLQADDILYIPDNSKMRVSADVLEHMAGFGTSTASGLIVWH